MAKQRIGLGATFATAANSQANLIQTLEEENERLAAEIAHLKASGVTSAEKEELQSKVNLLAQKLEQQTGSVEVPLSEIIRNPFQPRTIFPRDEIEAFANVLADEGQNTPIILIPIGEVGEAIQQALQDDNIGMYADGKQKPYWETVKFFIFDGERRWRAASLLGWNTIKAVFRPVDSVDFMQVQKEALSTTLQRKDLHELNLAECLVQQICYSYPELVDEEPRVIIPKILESAINRLQYLGKNSELRGIIDAPIEQQNEWLYNLDLKTEAEKKVLGVILQFRLNPGSIDSNVFPALKLPNDLKELIQSTGVEISKVNELRKLSADRLQVSEKEAVKIRRTIGDAVVEQRLKLSEVRAITEQELNQRGVQTKKKKSPADHVRSLKLDKLKREELAELKEALEKKLSELDARMQEA